MNEPLPKAVALRYDPARDGAPGVVAKGAGETARRILELAREHGVPVREDEGLLALLALCDVGEEIPGELHAAVAELLAYLVRLERELAGRGRPRDPEPRAAQAAEHDGRERIL